MSGRFVYINDTCNIFERAQRLLLDGRWPLAGNVSGISIGPLGDLLTALPILLTGKMESAYDFVCLLYLISIPVFFAAVKPFIKDPYGRCGATLWFASFPLIGTILITPWNTSYLPIFLALYTWTLGRFELNPHAGRLLVLYFLIGLCMHLHFTCLLLIPGTWVYLRGLDYRKRPPLIYHAAGLVIVIALHATVIYDYLHHANPLPGGANLSFSWLVFVTGLFLMPALVAFPALLLAFLGIFIPGKRAGLAALKSSKPLLLTMIVMALGVSLMAGLYGNNQVRYYFALFPFISILTGRMTAHFFSYSSKALRVAVASLCLIFLVALIRFGFLISDIDHRCERLSFQQSLADHVRDIIGNDDETAQGRIVHDCFFEDGEAHYSPRWSTDNCVDTMIRFRGGRPPDNVAGGTGIHLYTLARPVKWTEKIIRGKRRIDPFSLPPGCTFLFRDAGLATYSCRETK